MPFLERDGVALFHEDSGSGSPALVLVHGVCGDLRQMAPLARHFRSRHRVVSLDLRGHGRSAAPEQRYTIPGFADDVAWVGELGLARPVVVGHSMGGAVALELAASTPGLVAAVGVLDTAVLPSPEAWAGVRPILDALRTEAADAAFRDFVETAFFRPGDRSELKERLVAELLAAPAHVRNTAFASIFDWDGERALRACAAPVLYVGGTRPRSDPARLREVAPALVYGQVVCSGHYVQLEVPEQVCAMVDRFLEVALTA